MSAFLLLTGAPAAGKTAVASILNEEFRIQVVDVGNSLRDALTRAGVLCEHRAEIGPAFVRTLGLSRVYQTVLADAQHEFVVVDAIRSPRTCLQFLAGSEWATVWHVECSKRTRAVRLKNRMLAEGVSMGRIASLLSDYAMWDDVQAENRKLATAVLCGDSTPQGLRHEVRTEFANVLVAWRANERLSPRARR